MIYLDYSANTPADPAVLQAFLETEQAYAGNPNSDHPAGLAARERMAQATEAIARLLGAAPAEIIHTSGASEANNLALKGIAQASCSAGRHILTTVLEHASVSGPLAALQRQGWEIEQVEVGRDGCVSLPQLRERLRRDTVLVSVCAVDNELGTMQPIRQIAELVREFPHCRLHVDATQAVGKTGLALDGVDTMSIAPHKFYGLNGSGLLFKRRGLVIEPQIHGGSGSASYRSGTPALALAVSAEKALALALENREERSRYVRGLNGQLRAALLRYPRVRINSPETAVPHILNLSVQGVKGTVFQRALAERGVCVSANPPALRWSAPEGRVRRLPGPENALSSRRISLSHLTAQAGPDGFLQAFDACCRELARETPAGPRP